MKKICICGGGSLGHVIAGWLSAKQKAEVYVLSGRPEQWTGHVDVYTQDSEVLHGCIAKARSQAADVIPDAVKSNIPIASPKNPKSAAGSRRRKCDRLHRSSA